MGMNANSAWCATHQRSFSSMEPCPHCATIGTNEALATDGIAPQKLHQNLVCECHDCTQARSMVRAGSLAGAFEWIKKAGEIRLAVACKRAFDVDGVVARQSVIYVVKKETAT